MRIYDLKKGDRIRILKKPSKWSSVLSSKSPLHNLNFPTIVTIEQLISESMKCTQGFGWSLEYINEAGWEMLSEEGGHFLGFI